MGSNSFFNKEVRWLSLLNGGDKTLCDTKICKSLQAEVYHDICTLSLDHNVESIDYEVMAAIMGGVVGKGQSNDQG